MKNSEVEKQRKIWLRSPSIPETEKVLIWSKSKGIESGCVKSTCLCVPIFKLNLSDISFAPAAYTFIDSDNHHY